MPQLGADFARCVGSRVGVALDDAAASELAIHLELHMRRMASLAMKLARRARRRRVMRIDIIDSAECSPSGQRAMEPWALSLVQQCAAVAGSRARPTREELNILPLEVESLRPLEPAPVDFSLVVEWLAVNGVAVAGAAAESGSVIGLCSDGVDVFVGLTLGSAEVVSPSQMPACRQDNFGLLPAQPPLLDDEHLALLHRIVGVLDSGAEMARWGETVLRVCSREEATPIRPFIAQFLAHKIPLCIGDASPAELHLLLGVLEAITLVPRGAELYLHQCLAPGFLICTSPALGSNDRSSVTSEVVAGYCSIRRRGASLVTGIALRYRDSIPEVYAEVYRVFEEVLRRTPPLTVAAGAILGLAALGARNVEQCLVPMLLDGGLIAHLAEEAARSPVGDQDAAGRSNPDAAAPPAKRGIPFFIMGQSGLVSNQPTKRARHGQVQLATPSFSPREASRLMQARADAFEAMLEAAVVVATCSRRTGGGTVHGAVSASAEVSLRRAALLCEAAATTFDTDPTPLLTGLAMPELRSFLSGNAPSRRVAMPVCAASRLLVSL